MTVEDDGSSTKPYILLTLIFLICYIVLSAMLEHKHFPVHRSTVAILVGIVAGLILHLTSPGAYTTLAKLDEFIIFEVLLPPMLFCQGYTLHKSVFFKNVKYILIFGLVGTFLSFLVSWGLLEAANSLHLVRDAADFSNIRILSHWEILLLASCLCSIDPVASEESVSEYKYPRLYSVIFGEDMLKDSITIVLFDAVMTLEEPKSPDNLVVYWYTFFQMLLNFLVLILGSVALASVSAFATTYLSKKMRFMTQDKGVSQTGFLFLIGFLTYIVTEMLGFSGSLSVLLYGVFLNHYNIYNMKEDSRKASVTTFTLLSNICQGTLFLIMGLMVWQGQWESPTKDTDKMTHSYIFIAVVIVILCIARFFNIYVLGWLGRRISKKQFTICNEEMHVLFLGGLVRGAIPFVLFSSVTFSETNRYVRNEGMVLKTTIISVIILTSVVLNSLIPLFYKRRIKTLKNEYLRIFGNPELGKTEGKQNQNKLRSFDEKYVKKWLIYDYQARKQSIEEEKIQRAEAAKKEALEEEEQEEQEEKDVLAEEDGTASLID